jgi:hypothetical protein
MVITICLLASGLAYGQLSGPLSGTLGPGSYNVVDSIYVEAGNSLVINPGTDFLFMGAFGFGVAGELLAVGTQADSINFMPAFGVPFWNGFEFTSSAAPTCELQYCLITGSADMGIYLNYGSATISHCTFTMNSSVDMGGGIYSMYSASSISHCVFSYNTAVHGGGLVLRYTAPVLVDNLVFYGNNATYGGAIAQYFVSGFALTNCLFYQNSGNQGGAIRYSSSPSETINCTFADNTASEGAALFIINQTPVAKNIIAWGNVGDMQINVYAGGFTCTYSDVQGGFAGTGNIDVDPEFVAGPDGNYYLSQVAAGQATTSQCVDAGDPASPMIDGTTRTDGLQDAGVVDMGYHYACSGAALLVPGAPTAFTVANNGPALIASLEWINPSVNAGGDPLTELTGVKVYRNGTEIADLTDVVIGEPSLWEDTLIVVADMYTYELLPYNSHGNGITAAASAWIGLDTPGEPGNVVADPDPGFALECTITWTDPTTGGHGGYWPAGTWDGQKVYRDGAEIADLAGTNNSYLDDAVPAEGWYTYSVAYYNASGTGPEGEADPVYVGPPEFIEIPYNWVEINPGAPGGLPGTNTGITGDDQTMGPFPLGFTFPFYTPKTEILVHSNGLIPFDDDYPYYYNNEPIPDPSTPNDFIAPYWDDLNPSQGGSIWYYHDIPFNRFIVEFYQVPHYSTGGIYTFEVMLYTNGNIDIMYKQLVPGTANSATVGVENADGTEGIQVTYDGSGPLEPEEFMGIRIYSVAPPGQDIDVELTYVAGSPVPPSGGQIDYTAEVWNNETYLVNFDAWLDLTLPNSNIITLVNRELAMPGGAYILRALYLTVPGAAPAGTYTLTGKVGDNPDVIWDQSSFDFEKTGALEGAFDPGMITISGWFEPDDIVQVNQIPEEFALNSAYPNPFNPTTRISYALPEAARVKLSVYDIGGRLVTELVDGWRGAGVHEVTFDATGMASGVYIYRIQAGENIVARKMILTK